MRSELNIIKSEKKTRTQFQLNCHDDIIHSVIARCIHKIPHQINKKIISLPNLVLTYKCRKIANITLWSNQIQLPEYFFLVHSDIFLTFTEDLSSCISWEKAPSPLTIFPPRPLEVTEGIFDPPLCKLNVTRARR